jgi:hypothetical protein
MAAARAANMLNLQRHRRTLAAAGYPRQFAHACTHPRPHPPPPLQRCTAVKLVLVEESVADELVDRVVALVAKLTIGRRGSSLVFWCSGSRFRLLGVHYSSIRGSLDTSGLLLCLLCFPSGDRGAAGA